MDVGNLRREKAIKKPHGVFSGSDMACIIKSLLHALGVRADGVGVDRININYPELTSDKLSCSNSYTYVMRTTHLIIVIRVYSIV